MYEKDAQEGIYKELRKIRELIEHFVYLINESIKDDLRIEGPRFLKIYWLGDHTMAGNDVTLNLTAPFGNNQGVPVELNSDSSNFVFNPSDIAWQVQDSSVASFVQNSDGSATFTPLKVGSTGVAVKDNGTGLSATGTLTVGSTTPGPNSMSIKWNAPTSGAAPAAKV